MNIAVIPARGGSKRIPHKNIKEFCGKPIIAYSIETAISSNIFDKVIVSTDDKEIAETAKDYDAEVPFIRPAILSDDYTGTNAVIAHGVKWNTLDNNHLILIFAVEQGNFLDWVNPDTAVDFLVHANNALRCFR